MLPGYRFWPSAYTVTLPPTVEAPHFTLLPPSVTADVAPAAAASLSYTDTQGLRTTLMLSAGAVSQTTTLVLTPTVAPDTAGWAFTGHAFDLVARRSGQTLSDLRFNAPLTTTIRYSPADVRLISDPSKLVLHMWTGSAWQDIATTCGPTAQYTRDPANHTISVAICRAGRFALRGPTQQVYLALSVYAGL